jgi:hypothetical protein
MEGLPNNWEQRSRENHKKYKRFLEKADVRKNYLICTKQLSEKLIALPVPVVAKIIHHVLKLRISSGSVNILVSRSLFL